MRFGIDYFHDAWQARVRDLDQIQLVDLLPENREKLEAQPIDVEL